MVGRAPFEDCTTRLRPSVRTSWSAAREGGIHDVIVDLRQDSPTHLRYIGVSLTAENRAMLFVPKGFAHGFLTLADETEVAYQMSAPYSPEHARGVRWNDPLVGIRWPEEAGVISARDRTLPDYEP